MEKDNLLRCGESNLIATRHEITEISVVAGNRFDYKNRFDEYERAVFFYFYLNPGKQEPNI